MPASADDVPAALRAARRLVRGAERVVVLTGAGVSAESGVPTFRGAGGLWREHRAEELATPRAFSRDARLVWEWYGWRRDIVRGCAPNAAHLALAAFAAARDGVTIVTQNVDALHVRAAHAVAAELAASRGGRELGDAALALPIELHGSLFRARCTDCGRRAATDEPVDARDASTLPRCDRCGALLRPDVVWFGESLDPALLGAAFDAAAQADVCLVVGTSALVQPAASIATAARDNGARMVEVNPEATPLTTLADVSIRAAAAASVPTILGEAGIEESDGRTPAAP
jgi:NAD-dependent deacetylase